MNLRDVLQSIYDQHGELTPKLVVDEARDETHPLHTRFEWDDAVAGEKWRQEQAHELIRTVKIAYAAPDGQQRDVRAFHAMRKANGFTYEPVEKVAADEMSTAILLREAEREWRALHRKYQDLAEFLQMVRNDVAA